MAVKRMTPQQQAAQQRMAAQRRAQAAPFVAVEQGKPLTITQRMFTAQNQIVGSLSVLSYYQVPRNTYFELLRADPLYLQVKAQLTGDIADTDANTDFTVDIGAAGRLAIRSPISVTLPTASHPDVCVWLSTDSGANWTKATITAYDAAAGTVTFSKLASTAYMYEVYFLSGEGELVLQSTTPAGVDATTQRIYSSPLRALHETHQAKAQEAPRISGAVGDNISFAPKERIDLLVNSPATFVWNDRAEHAILIRGQKVRGVVRNEAAFNAAVQKAKF